MKTTREIELTEFERADQDPLDRDLEERRDAAEGGYDLEPAGDGEDEAHVLQRPRGPRHRQADRRVRAAFGAQG